MARPRRDLTYAPAGSSRPSRGWALVSCWETLPSSTRATATTKIVTDPTEPPQTTKITVTTKATFTTKSIEHTTGTVSATEALPQITDYMDETEMPTDYETGDNLAWWAKNYYTLCDEVAYRLVVYDETAPVEGTEEPVEELTEPAIQGVLPAMEAAGDVVTATVTDVKYLFLWGDYSYPFTEVTLQIDSSLKGSLRSGQVITLYESGGYMPLLAYLSDHPDETERYVYLYDDMSEVSLNVRSKYSSRIGDRYLYFLTHWNIEGMKENAFTYALSAGNSKFTVSAPYQSADKTTIITQEELDEFLKS
jgi:hypothetical protein